MERGKGMGTKETIIDAAVSLFNTKGFQGTAIREIAKKAEVNPALVSYYFGSKKGLLENLLLQFYEPYLQLLEDIVNNLPSVSSSVCLKEICKQTLLFQQRHIALTRFVYREMTLDSMLVREMMATYLKRESYLLGIVFKSGVQTGEFTHLLIEHAVVQLKGMLMMPYLYPQYLREVLYIQPGESYFAQRYLERINLWINSIQVFSENISIKKRASRSHAFG